MPVYNLTNTQKRILTIIVKHIKAGKVVEPIVPIIKSKSCLIEGIEKSFERNFIWDLEALCEAKLMNQRYSRIGNKNRKLYTVTKAGYEAVANKFIFPEEGTSKIKPEEEKIEAMSIEKIQAIWFADLDEIAQIVNNPSSTKETVDALTKQLLNAIETEISSYKLATYKRNIQDLKTQIVSNSPSQLTLQSLFSSLSFMENLESSIPLASTVWPYLYPLLLIARAKTSKES